MAELVDINAELVLTSFLLVKYIFCSWCHSPSAFPVSSYALQPLLFLHLLECLRINAPRFQHSAMGDKACTS